MKKNEDQIGFMRRAIALALENMKGTQGGPFGCVVVKNGKIIAEGGNEVTGTNDPTAHAEVVAVRKACRALKSFQLKGCDVYTSCEPCPMCLGALYWARPDRIFYSGTRDEAADAGFDDAFIYDEIPKPVSARKVEFRQLLPEEANQAFSAWKRKTDKIPY